MYKDLVIFTDLDETLLERSTCSYEDALTALRMVEGKGIPLVIVTSKTRPEIELYRERLRTGAPYVSENGGGIFIPAGYFADLCGHKVIRLDGLEAITLGTPYAALREALVALRARGFDVRGFGDMTAEEISALTGLGIEEAGLAKIRDFDEPFTFGGSAGDLAAAVRELGLNLTQGRLFHLIGLNDKGKAVGVLKELYSKNFGTKVFAALGDSPTDESMLRNVDYPVIVQKSDGTYDERLKVPGAVRAGGPGPKGWNLAVTDLIRKLVG